MIKYFSYRTIAILLVQVDFHAIGADEVAPDLVAPVRAVREPVAQLGEVNTLTLMHR